MGCLEQYYTCTKMKVSGSSTFIGAWGFNTAPPPLIGPLMGERGSHNTPPPHTAPKEGGPSLHQGGGCSLLHTPQHPPTTEPHLCPTVVPLNASHPLYIPKTPRGGVPTAPSTCSQYPPNAPHPPNPPQIRRRFPTSPSMCSRGPPNATLPIIPPNPEVCGGSLQPRSPPAHLRRVGRLLGGQHSVGAVLPGEVAHNAHRPPVLNAEQPQRFAVTGTAGRARRTRRSRHGERRSGGGWARGGVGGAGGQPELPDDVDDVPEGAVGAEQPLRDRFAALRAAQPPRGVLPALRHAGPAEIMAAFRHQHRVGEVLQAHRAGELVLKAPRSAARGGRHGGGSGRGLHRRSELRGEIRTAARLRPD